MHIKFRRKFGKWQDGLPCFFFKEIWKNKKNIAMVYNNSVNFIAYKNMKGLVILHDKNLRANDMFFMARDSFLHAFNNFFNQQIF